jgi:hypothetical protein
MIDKEKQKEVTKLVNIYMEYNPNNNRGIGYRAKANDIIYSYMITHKKTFDEIKECIESNPLCQEPIWKQFNDYFSKNKNKSNYKNSIGNSIDAKDWI